MQLHATASTAISKQSFSQPGRAVTHETEHLRPSAAPHRCHWPELQSSHAWGPIMRRVSQGRERRQCARPAFVTGAKLTSIAPAVSRPDLNSAFYKNVTNRRSHQPRLAKQGGGGRSSVPQGRPGKFAGITRNVKGGSEARRRRPCGPGYRSSPRLTHQGVRYASNAVLRGKERVAEHNAGKA